MRGGTPLRDAVWNLAGLLLPLPVAVAVVPALLAGLGEARFGLLTLAWAIMGYFNLFDFGLGRATTHGVAQALAARDTSRVLRLCWTSSWAHLAMGTCGGLLLALLASPISRVLNLDAALRVEFIVAMIWLAASIPVIVLATAARGILEGVGRFDAVNIVRLPATLWIYVAPWLVLQWTPSLSLVMAAIAIGRLLAALGLLYACVRSVPGLAVPLAPRPSLLAPLVHMGLWITVSTIGIPVMSTLDRLIIGSRISVEAVGWYAAPYEAVTKLWIISTAIMTVAFPTFSRAATANPGDLGRLLRHALAALSLTAFPVAMAIIVAAPVAIPLWLGPAGGREAILVTQLLAAGTAINVAAQAGGTLLQATTRADWVARVQVAGVALYALGTWWAAARWGIVGVAVVWAVRGVLAAVVLVALASAWTRRTGGDGLDARHLHPLACAGLVCLGWTWLQAMVAPPLDPGWVIATAAAMTVPSAWIWFALVDASTRRDLTRRVGLAR